MALRLSDLQIFVGPASVAPPGNLRYTLPTHKLAEYKKEDPMPYCEMFDISHTFGDRTCSSVIRTVLR